MQLIHPIYAPVLHARRSRTERRILALATCAVLSLATLSCGSDNPLGPGLGSGSVTATGAVSASGSGLAVFQSIASGGTSLFQIVVAPLSQGTTTWQLQIANYTGRLANGTYNLTALSPSSGNPTASFYYTSGATIQSFNSTSGQLVITTSSPSEVSGTFTFSGTDPAGGSGSVTAHGSFKAKCAPGFTCL